MSQKRRLDEVLQSYGILPSAIEKLDQLIPGSVDKRVEVRSGKLFPETLKNWDALNISKTDARYYVYEAVDLTDIWKSMNQSKLQSKFMSKKVFSEKILKLPYLSEDVPVRKNYSYALVGKIVSYVDIQKSTYDIEGPSFLLKKFADFNGKKRPNNKDPLYPSRKFVEGIFNEFEKGHPSQNGEADLGIKINNKYVAIEGKGKFFSNEPFMQVCKFFDTRYRGVIINTTDPFVKGYFSNLRQFKKTEMTLYDFFSNFTDFLNLTSSRKRIRSLKEEDVPKIDVLVKIYGKNNLDELSSDVCSGFVMGYLDTSSWQTK